VPLIEIRHLTYSVESRQDPVLKDISLSIHEGEYVCIVGCNGSGKSTLIRHLNGLIPAEENRIYIDQRPLNTPRDRAFACETIGVVFQNPQDQIISTVIEEDLAFGPENMGLQKEQINQKITEALQIVEMENYRHHSTQQLSAGQQQRIALAGVLAMTPRCLIMDEATSMLNPTAREDLLNRIDKLHKEGITLISVTHHLEELLRADRVLVLQQGRLVQDCRPEELLRSPHLASWGLIPLAWTESARGKGLSSPELPVTLNQFYHSMDWSNPPVIDRNKKENPPILASIESLGFHYPDGTRALWDLNFKLYQGERLILTGETGSGKSTLLHLLAGVRDAHEGSINWLQKNLVKGLALQNPETQLFKIFVGDDIAFGPRNQGLSGKELALRVKESMNLAGLPFREFKDRKTRELSGGEKRKAALAGILALNPRVLLLDEPAGGLDPMARKELNTLLDQLQQQGITLVISTHHMDEAVQGDRIMHLHHGQISIMDQSESFFYQPHLGLLPPPAVEMVQKARLEGFDWPEISRWEQLSSELQLRSRL